MSLAAGTRLGPYEIQSALGAGGMGEVYKARDPRLNRLVAIKLLPAAAATDPERRDRFEREAQAIAALNHPNIVTIYSVEEADGVFFLTMELVEGRSLAEALPTGGVSLDRLLKIAIPVADAMAAAHQKGITHRDLKPANIMLGEGEHAGRVKVLDFGLAKLTDVSLAATGASTLPTGAVTGEGRILGTVAYMSPEQAEAKPIDARSDLFSLGVILYEMATGQRPFTGETSLSILSSIIKDTPKSVTEVNPVLPRDLGRIVGRALVKDPERRYQTAKDLRNDLEEVKASLDSGELVAQATGSSAVPRSRFAPVWPWAVAALVVLVLAGGIYTLVQRRAQSVTSGSVFSSENLQVTQLTSTGNASRPAISPDGKYVAYVQQDGNDYSLWIRQTATSSNVQIVRAEPGVSLWGGTVTPDAAFVDFIRQRSGQAFELWRVPFLGGMPKRLIDAIWTPPGWSPDGRQLAFVRAEPARGLSSLVIADADGSHERVIAQRQSPSIIITLNSVGRPSVRPAWSPNARLIAVTGLVPAGARKIVVICVDVATGTERVIPVPLQQTPDGLGWLDEGSLALVARSDAGTPAQLWRLSYPEGRLSRLTNDVNSYRGISLTAARDALVTGRSDSRASVWVGDGDARTGTDVVPLAPFLANPVDAVVAWAADRVLYATANGRRAIASVLPGRGTPEEIVVNAGNPAATSDGRTIAFVSSETDARAGLWKVDAEGRHAVQLVSGNASSPLVTADDRYVVFLSARSGLQSPWIVPIDGGTPTQIVNVFAGVAGFDLSPDGKSLVFASRDEANRDTFIVCDLPTCANRRNVPLPPNNVRRKRWTPDGRSIAYIDVTQANIRVQPLDGTAPRQLTHFTDGRAIGDFAWSHDGKRLAVSRVSITNDIVLFKGLKK